MPTAFIHPVMVDGFRLNETDRNPRRDESSQARTVSPHAPASCHAQHCLARSLFARSWRLTRADTLHPCTPPASSQNLTHPSMLHCEERILLDWNCEAVIHGSDLARLCRSWLSRLRTAICRCGPVIEIAIDANCVENYLTKRQASGQHVL